MTIYSSVIIPVYNGGHTIGACLNALAHQSLDRREFEVIVVDDGSTDTTASAVSRHPVHLIRQTNQGAPAARNRGIDAARGQWVAFTDADCVPSRTWLENLLKAVKKGTGPGSVLGAAGRVIGYGSETEASRFVDLVGGLDSEPHLAHPRYPFATFGNVMYRRDALLAAGGLDPRFHTYDACDLHTRLMRKCPGEFYFEPGAVVLHHHRPSWRAYWRQQMGYGKGLGQFYWHYRNEIQWSAGREIRAWLDLFPMAMAGMTSGKTDESIVRRGLFIKNLAQRFGFVQTYFSRKEHKRWRKNLFGN